eukprot:454955-Amphidinium_carterae.1
MRHTHTRILRVADAVHLACPAQDTPARVSNALGPAKSNVWVSQHHPPVENTQAFAPHSLACIDDIAALAAFDGFP